MKRVVLLAAMFLLMAAPAQAYTRAGIYTPWMAGLTRSWHTSYQLMDGVPLIALGPGVFVRNPTSTAQYGLISYTLWRRYHDQNRWTAARHAADWLVFTQPRNGAWRYWFDHQPQGAELLYAPWTSSLAQGNGLSLLGRVYRRTHDPRYLRAIHRAITPLAQPVRVGGLMRRAFHGMYFEEYPTQSRPNWAMNGNLYVLLGLYDVEDLDWRAGRLFRLGVRAQARGLHLFDRGDGRAAYSLVNRNPAPAYYDEAIRRTLRALTTITGRRVFDAYAARWSAMPYVPVP